MGAASLDSLDGRADWVNSVFSLDSRASCWDQVTILFVFARMQKCQGAALFDALEGHTHWVSSVAFSPDSRRIVSQGSGNKTVCVWDVETGAVLRSPGAL